MTPNEIANTFRAARMDAQRLENYPGGNVPQDLQSAYAIQDEAIANWPDKIAGWKVAAIQPSWRERYKAERLAGPIFARTVWAAQDALVEVPVIEGGYVAIEAECAIKLSEAIPFSAPFSNAEQLLPYVEGVYAAFEIAASPLSTLSALGPGAVVSDFGNNGGLVIGGRLPDAVLTRPADFAVTMEVNGENVGLGDASRVPGGPLSALMFLVEHLASRGRGLDRGQWISTGACTGIHIARIGDEGCARFADNSVLSVAIRARIPR